MNTYSLFLCIVDSKRNSKRRVYGVKANLPIAAYWYIKYANSAVGARDSSAKAALARLRKRVVPAKSGDVPDSAGQSVRCP